MSDQPYRDDGDDPEPYTGPHIKDPMVLRQQVMVCLSKVIDPDLCEDIVTLGFVHNLKADYDAASVSFTLNLTSPACPVKADFVKHCEDALKQLEWAKNVTIDFSAVNQPQNPLNRAGKHLEGVQTVIAVYSCKGGVGKSTVAMALAKELHRSGLAVGVCDCDISGPSLNTLSASYGGVKGSYEGEESRTPETADSEAADSESATRQPDSESTTRQPDSESATRLPDSEPATRQLSAGVMNAKLSDKTPTLTPIEKDGLKLMSYGYFKPNETDCAAFRGPLLSQITMSFITSTKWGKLDVLVLDLPPGSADIHLTIGEGIIVHGCVMVTTADVLALADVERGMQLFKKLHIPTALLVENMAYLECPTCGSCQSLWETETPSNATADASSAPDRARSSNEDCCDTTLVHPETPSESLKTLMGRYGVGAYVKLPFDRSLRTGRMVNDSCALAKLREVMPNLIREMSKLQFGTEAMKPDISLTPDGKFRMIVPTGGDTCEFWTINPVDLRKACPCAACSVMRGPTGQLRVKTFPEIEAMESVNNYSVHILWRDEHVSLFSHDLLKELGGPPERARSRCLDADPDFDW